MIKIAVLANGFLPDETTGINGTQVQMYNLAKAFVEYNVEVHYITLTLHNKKDHEIFDGIHVHWVPYKRKILDWQRQMKMFLKVLNTVNPDAVYTRGRSVFGAVCAKWAKTNRKPYVWGSNGYDSLDFWRQMTRLWRSKRSLIRKIMLSPFFFLEDIYINHGMKNATHVVNQTLHQQKMTLKKLNKNGVLIFNYFSPTEVNLKKEKIVLWLANLSLEKQPHVFINLAKDISEMYGKGWKFVLAGGTDNKHFFDLLFKDVSDKPFIKMTGKVLFMESMKLFQKAALLINTSRNLVEGIPNTFIQAWLSGIPVLSLNHDPNNWLENEEIGFCAHGDYQKLVSFCRLLLENDKKREAMGSSAREFALKTFASPHIIKNYIKLFTTSR